MERSPFATLQAATRARLRARDGRAVVYFVDINIAAVESVVAEYVIGAMFRACPCRIDYVAGSAMRTYKQVANAYVLEQNFAVALSDCSHHLQTIRCVLTFGEWSHRNCLMLVVESAAGGDAEQRVSDMADTGHGSECNAARPARGRC